MMLSLFSDTVGVTSDGKGAFGQRPIGSRLIHPSRPMRPVSDAARFGQHDRRDGV